MVNLSRASAALLPWKLALLCCFLFSSACGDSQKDCFDDRSCDPGFRCSGSTFGQAGVCAPCDPTETPYDGEDNDCNPGTRDSDLDGDGDNAIDAAINPGGDCDDGDPSVSSFSRELCGDSKDNDCDNEVDEIDCGDMTAPTLEFRSPSDGEGVFGPVTVEIRALDDVGVTNVVLKGNGVEIESQDATPMREQIFRFTFDSTTLADGQVTLQAEGVDVSGKTAVSSIIVRIDNVTGPTITMVRPIEGGAYSGLMTIEPMLDDLTGIGLVRLTLDGNLVGQSTGTPALQDVDTSSLAEGAHTLVVQADDMLGNRSEQTVNFTVDRTAPNVVFDEPMPDDVLMGTVRVSVTATDASGISEVRFDGNVGPSPLDIMVDTSTYANGRRNFVAFAEDNTEIDNGMSPGNVATATISVVINNVDPSPVVTFVDPRDGEAVFRSTRVEVDVSSPVMTSISAVTFFVDGVQVDQLTGPPWETRFDFSNKTGTAVIDVHAEDANNLTAVASATVAIAVPPSFRVAPVRATGASFNGNAVGFDHADINGDTVLDVVAAGSAIQIMTGTISASGEFALNPGIEVARSPTLDILLGDIDDDNLIDAIGLVANGFRIYRGRTPDPMDPNDRSYFESTAEVINHSSTSGFRAFAQGDLDNDQDMDLVLAKGSAGTLDVSVFILDNGVYVESADYGLVGSVTDIELADVDNDNDLDIVLGRTGNGNNVLTVYRNNGVGMFGSGLDSFTPAPPSSVEVADLDGDNFPDIAALMPSVDSFVILNGNPNTPGSFTFGNGAFGVQPGAEELTLANLNADTFPEIVVAATGANGIEVWTNLGASFGFSESFTVARELVRPTFVDFDGDMDLDLLATGRGADAIAYVKHLGDGDFAAAPNLLLGEPVQAVAAADVVGGAAPDILFGLSSVTGMNQAPARLVILENVATNFLQQAPSVFSLGATIQQPTSIATGNLDQQAGIDIAIGSNETIPGMNSEGTALMAFNTGGGTFSGIAFDIDRPRSVATGDVNNDGIDEAIFSFDAPGPVDGAEVVSSLGGIMLNGIVAGEGAGSVAVGDLNGDALIDFAVANFVTNNITVNTWNAAQMNFNTQTFNAVPGIVDIGIGQVNDDNLNDIVAVGTNTLLVLQQDASLGGFRPPVTYPTNITPSRFVGGDFNGDGLFDVIVLSSADDEAALMLARPQGGFFEPAPIELGSGPTDLVVADFDGDGRQDLALGHTGSGALMLIYNNADSL